MTTTDELKLVNHLPARALAKALRSIAGGRPIVLDASFSLASLPDDVARFEREWGPTLRALPPRSSEEGGAA